MAKTDSVIAKIEADLIAMVEKAAGPGLDGVAGLTAWAEDIARLLSVRAYLLGMNGADAPSEKPKRGRKRKGLPDATAE